MKIKSTLLRKSLLATALALAAGQAMAVDTGTIAAGTGNVVHNGATTQINQNSDKLIVNWNNFDIARGETVNISQPGANSAILNRVTGSQAATRIDGALNANGRVFVVNPNGVVVGQSGNIHAAGVVLSALNVSDQDFIDGGKLTAGAATASVQNAGTITANGGDVVLIAPQVVNQSTGGISVHDGNVRLQASSGGLIDASAGVGGGSYAAPADNALAANDGSITVVNGSISLAASYSDDSAREVLRNTGTLSASGKGPSNLDDYYDSWLRGAIDLSALHTDTTPNTSGYYGYKVSTDKAVTGHGVTNVGGTLAGNWISVNASDVVNLLNGVKITASYQEGGDPFLGPQGGTLGIYGGTINQLGSASLHGDAFTDLRTWSQSGY